MHRRIALLALLLLALPAAVHADTAPDLRITEILPVPDAALGQREFVELLNAGTTPVDLSGWMVRDAPTASNATNSFTFGAVQLDPGHRIVVWSNGSADAIGPSWSSSPSKTVWNDAGDAATLLDPQGRVKDWVGYGSTTQQPPPGFAMSKPAAPGRGKSIQLANGAWSAAEPTPGLAPGQQGGGLAVHVGNVAPTVTLRGPATARAGATAVLHLNVTDANGAADVASWSIASRGQVVRQGNGSYDGDVTVPVPTTAGSWVVTATAQDAGSMSGNSTVTVAVRQPRIAVGLPPGGALRFPDLRPGDRNVTSLDTLTLRNDGDELAQPRLDMSALRAGRAAIGVERNLWLGVTVDGETTWVRYDAALQALPALEPGEAATLALRIGEVPVPAAAGLYGTTFTVVAT